VAATAAVLEGIISQLAGTPARGLLAGTLLVALLAALLEAPLVVLFAVLMAVPLGVPLAAPLVVLLAADLADAVVGLALVFLSATPPGAELHALGAW